MILSELIGEVAAETGIPATKVATVLHKTLDKLRSTAMSGEAVRLRGFGVFYPTRLKQRPVFGGTKIVESREILRFKESRSRRQKMEKYGVVIADDAKVEDGTKVAAVRKCPTCGEQLDPSFPKCSSCGTKPFEKQQETK